MAYIFNSVADINYNENGIDPNRRRNSLGHMAPLGLTGELYSISLTGQLGLARTQTRAALTNYATQPPQFRWPR
ncbi:hypothetical protein E2C01_030930 [Portunus trituberculatus]|uniref:Uncharacterized protein n=1 Tax=Portunus trituberculatus TaxID=210409 RepID=A0A5B7ERQ5_PORTR|nr:hypothetical protein [Portunus trituberculatus]